MKGVEQDLTARELLAIYRDMKLKGKADIYCGKREGPSGHGATMMDILYNGNLYFLFAITITCDALDMFPEEFEENDLFKILKYFLDVEFLKFRNENLEPVLPLAKYKTLRDYYIGETHYMNWKTLYAKIFCQWWVLDKNVFNRKKPDKKVSYYTDIIDKFIANFIPVR